MKEKGVNEPSGAYSKKVIRDDALKARIVYDESSTILEQGPQAP